MVHLANPFAGSPPPKSNIPKTDRAQIPKPVSPEELPKQKQNAKRFRSMWTVTRNLTNHHSFGDLMICDFGWMRMFGSALYIIWFFKPDANTQPQTCWFSGNEGMAPVFFKGIRLPVHSQHPERFHSPMAPIHRSIERKVGA